MKFGHLRRAIAAAGVMAIVAAGCGDDDGGGGGEADAGDEGGEATGELTTIEVGVVPVVDVAPLYLGIEQGFFEEEGLDVQPAIAQGGAAIIPAVVNGDQEIVF